MDYILRIIYCMGIILKKTERLSIFIVKQLLFKIGKCSIYLYFLRKWTGRIKWKQKPIVHTSVGTPRKRWLKDVWRRNRQYLVYTMKWSKQFTWRSWNDHHFNKLEMKPFQYARNYQQLLNHRLFFPVSGSPVGELVSPALLLLLLLLQRSTIPSIYVWQSSLFVSNISLL